MQLLSPKLTHKCSTMSPANPFILGSKGQRSRSQKCMCRSSDRTQYCRCCVRKLRWIFPAVMPRRTSSASDTGFFLRHFPASDHAMPCVSSTYFYTANVVDANWTVSVILKFRLPPKLLMTPRIPLPAHRRGRGPPWRMDTNFLL